MVGRGSELVFHPWSDDRGAEILYINAVVREKLLLIWVRSSLFGIERDIRNDNC